jgi:hypothetical protein
MSKSGDPYKAPPKNPGGPKHPTSNRDPAPVWPTRPLVPQDQAFPQFFAGAPGTTYGECKLWATDEFNAECADLIANQYGGPSTHASRSITFFLTLFYPQYQCITTVTAFPDLPQTAKDSVAMGCSVASTIAPQGFLPCAYDAAGKPVIGLNAGTWSRTIAAKDVLAHLRKGLADYLYAGGIQT